MSARWIHFFGEAWSAEIPADEARALLGGKGAGLDSLTRAAFAVPPGFTITTAACRLFFEHDETWPPELAAELTVAMARLEELTGRKFGGDTTRLLVAVRSGAAVSMPGMMDTVLNVGDGSSRREEAPSLLSGEDQSLLSSAATRFVEGSAASDELVAAINAVFRSWHSERAVAWRHRYPETAGLAGTAVNIQAMVPAAISGVVFTRNPQQLLTPNLLIEAVRGLGTALVSGEITPERFVVSRDNFNCFIGGPPKPGAALSPGDAAHLARLALRVENHCGAPQDIEWALADGKFWILQARPIRGWLEACRTETARLEIITRLHTQAAKRRRVWVTHNLGETLRFPTPLTWSVVRQFMSGAGGFGAMYRRLGYRPSDEVCREGFLDLIGGRLYADPERLAQFFWAGFPLSYDLSQVARDPGALQRAPARLDPDRVDGTLLFRLPAMARSLLHGARKLSTQRNDAARRFEQDILPPYLEWVRSRRADNLAGLSTRQLLEEFELRRARVFDQFGSEALQPAFFGGLAAGALETSLAQLMGPGPAAQTVQELTAALPGEIGAEQDALLERVARREATLADFLDQFGHRAAGEMELMTPRWRERPDEIEALLASLGGRSAAESAASADTVNRLALPVAEPQRSGVSAERRTLPPATMAALCRDAATAQGPGNPFPSARRTRAAERRAEAERRLPDLLAECGGSSQETEIVAQLREAQALLPYRERGRHFLMAGHELLRSVAVELGRRWDLGDAVFFLEAGELSRFESERAGFLPRLEQRREERAAVRRIELPDVIDSMQLHRLGQSPPPLLAKGDWQGAPLAAGLGEGPVFVTREARDLVEFRGGEVLVCPSTDPGWMPLLLRARALVVERGGMLSHGAIVARDLGLPAVVLPGATELLRAGQTVRVDGHTGSITVVAKEAHD